MTDSPHTISYTDLVEFVSSERWERYASSLSKRGHKVFEVSTLRMYKVTVNGKVVYNGQSPIAAMNAYNEAC